MDVEVLPVHCNSVLPQVRQSPGRTPSSPKARVRPVNRASGAAAVRGAKRLRACTGTQGSLRQGDSEIPVPCLRLILPVELVEYGRETLKARQVASANLSRAGRAGSTRCRRISGRVCCREEPEKKEEVWDRDPSQRTSKSFHRDAAVGTHANDELRSHKVFIRIELST